MSGGWNRRIRTVAAVAAAAVVASTMATDAASATAGASRTVTVTFTGIGLGGQAVSIPSNQTALWSLASKNNTGPIYAGANGQYHVPPGAYLAGGYVPVSSGNYQNSVVIRQVSIRASETITLDSRGAKPFSVALTGVSATQQAQYADVCFGGGTGAGCLVDRLPA